MSGFDKFTHAIRQGQAIRRGGWEEGMCVSNAGPGTDIAVYKKTKAVGDGLKFEDIIAGDWVRCETPDFGRTSPKKGQGKVKPPPADPGTTEGRKAGGRHAGAGEVSGDAR